MSAVIRDHPVGLATDLVTPGRVTGQWARMAGTSLTTQLCWSGSRAMSCSTTGGRPC